METPSDNILDYQFITLSTIETPVEFVRHLENRTITEMPVNVTFECELSKADVKVQWQCGDQVIMSSEKYSVQMDGTVHRLTIHDANGADVAEYTAVARGKTSKASLNVQGKILIKK